MRAAATGLDALLRSLGRYRAVLLHGSDSEQVRAAADRIVLQEAGSLSDAFAVTVCDADDQAGIRAALLSPSFSAGRRVVRVRDAGDRLAPVVHDAGAPTIQGLLVLEAGVLPPKSKLSAAVGDSPVGCAVTCNRVAGGADTVIGDILRQFGVRANGQVLATLAAQTEAAHGGIRMVALRAALFAAGENLTEAEAALLGSDPGHDRLDLAMQAGLAGDVVTLDSGVTTAMAESTTGIALLRMALFATQRARREAGRGQYDAGPDRVRSRWSDAALDIAAAKLAAAERVSKSTGTPVDVVSRMAVLSLVLGPGTTP